MTFKWTGHYLLKWIRFPVKKRNIKKNTGKMAKNTGKVREFCQSGKVGTLVTLMMWTVDIDNRKRGTHLSEGVFWRGYCVLYVFTVDHLQPASLSNVYSLIRVRIVAALKLNYIITARNEVGARLYFHRRLWFCPQGGWACLAGGVHGGGHVWPGGVDGSGHAWWGACMASGLCGEGRV